MRRTTRSLIAAAILTLGNAAAIGAQAPAAPEWRIQLDPFADLWFHGIALARIPSGGALSLYDAGYASGMSALRVRAGVRSGLDEELPRLRRALATDSALEVLHFVPLYFAGDDPEIALATIRAAARGRPAPASATPRITAAASALVAALPTSSERETLAAFADALDDEWRVFYRRYHAMIATANAAGIVTLQRDWDRRFTPALSSYLGAERIARGTVLLVPALGPDGRMRAVPGPGTSIVAVSFVPESARPDTPLFFAVRELSYPLVHEAEAAALDSASAETESGRAAVRAGALLLDGAAPALAAGYRSVFLAVAGLDDAASPAAAFDMTYPIPPALERALKRAVPTPVAVPGSISSMQTP